MNYKDYEVTNLDELVDITLTHMKDGEDCWIEFKLPRTADVTQIEKEATRRIAQHGTLKIESTHYNVFNTVSICMSASGYEMQKVLSKVPYGC